MVIGEKGAFIDVPSSDYDMDIQLVRYKDVLYDIPTGLWVVKLSHIQKNFSYWKGCGAFPDVTMGGMIELVKTNSIFKHRLEQQRKKVYDNHLAEVMNEVQQDLFSFM